MKTYKITRVIEEIIEIVAENTREAKEILKDDMSPHQTRIIKETWQVKK